jgi:predicted site-specific integrase-resolvase
MKPDENIDQWCKRRGISRTTFCKWVKRGRAPVVIRIGGVARITARHDAEWERREAKRTKSKAAQREAERLSAQNSVAGKIAVKSLLHVSNRKQQSQQAAE